MNNIVDILIVGGGIAGLYSALNLRTDLNIILISKGKIKDTNSYLAQGGISTAKNRDDIGDFIEDTLKAGNYKNDVNAVKVLANESIENIKNLIKLGVDFDNQNGSLLYTKEGAHTANRIVHYKDYTGKKVIEILLEEALKRKNITIIENAYLADLISQNNVCYGGIIFKDNKQINIFSKYTILAAGGIGGLFKNSTNQRIITGDGIAIAIKNNIRIKDVEYIQFHPTALYEENVNKRFLISESLRGEGAVLLNSKGERFANELLPRDELTEKIRNEIKNSGIPYVYLKVSHIGSLYIKDRFPGIYKECLNHGIDITKDLIPVSPAQHYFMGGIEVDLESKTSMEKLFAAGEVSCTGVHGENRLASNSLLEALVFSKRCADFINKNINHEKNYKKTPEKIIDLNKIKNENKSIVINEITKRRWDLKDELINY